MASVIQPPPPPPPIVTTPRLEEHLVDEQIRRTRRSLKWVDFGSGLLTLVIGVLVFLLSMSVLEHWVIPGGWNGPTRIALFSIMLLGIAWYAWRTFWPLISRPINPAYAAQLIERSSPSLKNSLLNFLLLRNRRQQLSQKVYQAIEQQAAQRLSEVSLDSVIDRSAMLRLGYVLVAVVAICALYRVLSPKNLTASMERVLLPWSDTAVPSRVEILNVTPGDAQIARGEHLEVTAEVLGLRTDEPVRVRYSTLDGQSVDREVTLNGSEGSSRFQGRLPDRFSVGGGSDNGGVQQDFEYWIEAGDAKSPKYRVTVFARPTLVVEKIRYQFPAYTGLLPRDVEGTGDVNALEGTKVSLYALANHEIATASVDFGADGRNDLPMSAEKEKATAQFTLALQEDRRTPEHDSYVLQYKTKSGRISSLPPKYSIDVTPDYAPEVRILAPVDDEGKLVEQLDVAVDSPFTVEVEARDPDFALKNVVLLGDVAGEQVLKHDLLTQEQSGKFVGQFTATPAELKLKPGDILEYSAAAIDNREPEPNIAQTEKLRIRVLGPPEFGEQQGQGQGETPQGGQGGESEQGGQGENGEQGQAGSGGTGGESGKQQEGEAGSAAGEQSGEGQSQGEQQGQGAQGGNQGEGQQDGEPASAGGSGNQQGEQQNGDQQGEAASAGGGEQDEQQQGDPSGQGGQQSSEGQPGEQSKVSAEGDSDGEAFERMSEHFAKKGGQSQAQQEKGQQGQESQGESETQQSGSEGETQSNEGAGQGSKSEEPTEGESGKNQDQGIDGAQESEQSEGSGAEGQPSDQQGEAASAGGEKGEQQGEKQEAPGGKMSTEQGEQGAGNNPGENEGSADTDAGRKPSDKQDNGPDSEMNDEEASGQANSQKESDSQGSAGGDQSGGGQEGAGQQADSQGTGTAGENTAADDGAGQSQESGAGENSSQAGQQGQSDKPTGESSENQTGEGSKQSEQPGGEGAAASGDQSQSNPGENGEPGEGAAASGKDGQQPGEPASAGGEKSEQPPQGSQPSGNPGQGPPSGGTGNNNATPPPAGELAPGDEANLDYTRKQTDLVLDRLDEQLKKNEVDEALLDKLGWSKEELQRFVDRWKSLKAEATATPGEETQSELDSALRSLGLNPNRRTGFQAQVTKEKLRQLQDSYRGQTPLEYADQVRAYIKGTAAAPEEKAD